MQNWAANLVLRSETQTPDAVIISMVTPMKTNPITIDKFQAVND
jgi:hypothetical protein